MNKSVVVKCLIHGVILIAAVAVVAMLLWNCLIPTITGWSVVNYWQMLGLMLLGRLLTGGIGGRLRRHNLSERAGRGEFQKMSKEERREYLKMHFAKKRE